MTDGGGGGGGGGGSGALAMSELIDTKTESYKSPNKLLAELAERMRQYDDIVEDRRLLEKRKRSRQAVIEELLAGLGLDLPAAEYPETLARRALEQVIIDRKIDNLNDQIGKLQPNRLDSIHLYGMLVEVTSLDPERHKIGTSIRGRDGELNGMSQWHTHRKGQLDELDLDLDSGGYILFTGRFGKVYSAGRLIDRENDYSPAFSIEPVE